MSATPRMPSLGRRASAPVGLEGPVGRFHGGGDLFRATALDDAIISPVAGPLTGTRSAPSADDQRSGVVICAPLFDGAVLFSWDALVVRTSHALQFPKAFPPLAMSV